MSGVLDVLKRTGGLWWRHWPWLVAVCVVGWLARYWSLNLALFVAVHFGGLWGDLVFPLAPLSQMLTYVAMFCVLRRTVTGVPLTARGFLDTVSRSVLPIFVLFALWKIPMKDRAQYESMVSLAARQSDIEGLAGRTHVEVQNYLSPTDWRMYAAIAVAFTGRMLLTRYKNRLPIWVQAVSVYLEAVWVLLLANAAAGALFGTPTWIAERRVVVWYAEQRTELLSLFGPLKFLWEWTSNLGAAALPTVFIPLTWVAIAGVVFAVQSSISWGSAGQTVLGHQHAEWLKRKGGLTSQNLRSRWSKSPVIVQNRGKELFKNLLGIVDTLADSIRLVLHAGALNVAFFIFLFIGLVALYPAGAYYDPLVGDGYAWRLVTMLIGPHNQPWWTSFGAPLRVGIGALIDPVRVCLVSAMFWYCLDRVSTSED